jgi:hypothetical protein
VDGLQIHGYCFRIGKSERAVSKSVRWVFRERIPSLLIGFKILNPYDACVDSNIENSMDCKSMDNTSRLGNSKELLLSVFR